MDWITIILAIANIVLATVAILQYSQLKSPILLCKLLGEKNFTRKQHDLEQNPQYLVVSNHSENLAKNVNVHIHISSKDGRINIHQKEHVEHINPYESVRFLADFSEVHKKNPTYFKKIIIKNKDSTIQKEIITPSETLNLEMDIILHWGLFGQISDSFTITWQVYDQRNHNYFNSNIQSWNKRNGHYVSKIEPEYEIPKI